MFLHTVMFAKEIGLKTFEREIIQELLGQSELASYSIPEKWGSESLEFSGVGYCLTLVDPILPKYRIVLDRPNIQGKLSDIDVGYVAFVENSKITLECNSVDQEIQPNHREQNFVRNAA